MSAVTDAVRPSAYNPPKKTKITKPATVPPAAEATTINPTSPDDQLKDAIAGYTPPPLATADAERAADLARDVIDAAASVQKRPGMDPADVLARYRDTATEVEESKAEYAPGATYHDRKVLQSSVQDTHHGAAWALTLDNGDAVLVSLAGVEYEYVVADVAVPSSVVPPSTDVPDMDAPPLDPPDDVLATPKFTSLLTWVMAQDPKGSTPDVDRMVAQLDAIRSRCKSLARCKDVAGVRRRVLGGLAAIGAA
jgi:hypothetical protein